MSRTTRALLCALCLVTFGFAAAPAFALPSPVLTPVSVVRLFHTVTAVGAGETVAEAEANAVASLTDTYIVLGYTVTNAFCTETPLWPHDPDSEMITICAVEIEARVIRKIIIRP